MTLVDMLRIEGIEARVVENRMTSIVEEALPEGEVDAVISTADTSVTAANVASFFTCHADEKTAAAAASTTAAPTSAEPAPTKSESPASTQQKLWSGNLSLACANDFDDRAQGILSGGISAQQGLEMSRQVKREQACSLPLMDESRLRASDAASRGGSSSTLGETEGRRCKWTTRI